MQSDHRMVQGSGDFQLPTRDGRIARVRLRTCDDLMALPQLDSAASTDRAAKGVIRGGQYQGTGAQIDGTAARQAGDKNAVVRRGNIERAAAGQSDCSRAQRMSISD